MTHIATVDKFLTRQKPEVANGTSKLNQLGINMVDLMMWLVIAALLLAAALQGIGFYQKAAWNYQLKSDADAVRTYMETQYTLNTPNRYTAFVTTPADLKLTSSNGVTNTAMAIVNADGSWTASVCSKALAKATGSDTGAALTFSAKADPAKSDCWT